MKTIVVWLLALTVMAAQPARAGDPFDDARWAIGARDNATVLRIVDSRQFPIDMQNGEGYTLLHFAAGEGNLAIVEALLQRGADPGIKTFNPRLTPLDRAIGTMVSVRLARAMAERAQGGPSAAHRPAVGSGDFDKVRHAIGSRNDGAARDELDKGIDIDMRNLEGYTLLHFAAGDGNLAMVDELLRRGADPNIRTESGQTALDRAMGTMVTARIRQAGGVAGSALQTARAAPVATAQAPAAPTTPAPPAAKPAPAPAPAKRNEEAQAESPHAKMCASRHYHSSALCSDSTCKMREYRKWQTCLKTGSYY